MWDLYSWVFSDTSDLWKKKKSSKVVDWLTGTQTELFIDHRLTWQIKTHTEYIMHVCEIVHDLWTVTHHCMSSGVSLISCTHSSLKGLLRPASSIFPPYGEITVNACLDKNLTEGKVHSLNDLCVMTFKCFIFVSALHSALLCNSSQLTNHTESRGHIRTEAWVGVSPPAVRLHVGWNSLISAEYSFVNPPIFFQWATPSRYSLHAGSGTSLVGLALIWEIQLDSADMVKQHDRNIYGSGTETGPVATGVLYGGIHFNISLQRG